MSDEESDSTIELIEPEPDETEQTSKDLCETADNKGEKREDDSCLSETTSLIGDTSHKEKFSLNENPLNGEHANNDMNTKKIMIDLGDIYKSKVLPLERKYHLDSFCLPTCGEVKDVEFHSKPMVLLLGQYSTGKTSFIRHMIGDCEFPGMHVGPEATTDKFVALVHGGEDGSKSSIHGRVIKGSSLTVTPELPFSALSKFGSAFLKNFYCSISPSPFLSKITFIDTPGVFSGEKQRVGRGYDFAAVAKWFADRSSLIIVMFDAHKLDISDELKDIIQKVTPHNEDKIRVVLNKADGVNKEQFVRVYGSLMWGLGRIMQRQEVLKVYAGSFWDEKLINKDLEKMFLKDEGELMEELKNLHSCTLERKVNELVTRIRLIKVHICLLGYIRNQMPTFFGWKSKLASLMEDIEGVAENARLAYGLSKGDMPNLELFREKLNAFSSFSVIPALKKEDITVLDDLISRDIPKLMNGVAGVSTGNLTEDTMQGRVPKRISTEGYCQQETLCKKRKTIGP